MLRALVVDDEGPARDELKFLLAAEEGLCVVGEADSGPSAIGMAALHKPDVVFLDVQMHGMSGMETALAIRAVVPLALIVFATAYDEYAIKAFQIGAVDYLLKPFESERIKATVERLRKYRMEDWREASRRIDQALSIDKATIRKLPVEKNGRIVLVNYDDILYAYAKAGTAMIVTITGEASYTGSMSDLESHLRGLNFFRVHKSYIVNLMKVKEVIPWFKGTYWLKVDGLADIEIPVSKAQIKEIKDILGLR